MPEYLVTWQIEIDAKEPAVAARRARHMMLSPRSTATSFDVQPAECGPRIRPRRVNPQLPELVHIALGRDPLHCAHQMLHVDGECRHEPSRNPRHVNHAVDETCRGEVLLSAEDAAVTVDLDTVPGFRPASDMSATLALEHFVQDLTREELAALAHSLLDRLLED